VLEIVIEFVIERNRDWNWHAWTNSCFSVYSVS